MSDGSGSIGGMIGTGIGIGIGLGVVRRLNERPKRRKVKGRRRYDSIWDW